MQTMSAPWRKSSYSSANGGQCVETGSAPGAVLVRDTKDRERGPVLRVSPDAWSTFMGKIRAGN
jgi:hypothetical protein